MRTSIHSGRTVFVIVLMLLGTATVEAQGQGRGRGAFQRRGGVVGRGAGPGMARPDAAIPSASPVRSCESLTMVSLPNTTIESASVDPNNAANFECSPGF